MLYRKEKELTAQTDNEELANAITHGIGFVISLFGCLSLITRVMRSGDILYIMSAVFYGASLVATYTASTFYHLCRGRAKEIFRRLDHTCIYLLITGTYIPISLLVLKGNVGWTIFGIECSLCFIGITFKAIYGFKYAALSGAFYLLMGWMIIFALEPLVASLPIHALAWLFAGGVFYTFGFVFFALDQRYHYFHAVWHVFVLAGSFAHFCLISTFVFLYF